MRVSFRGWLAIVLFGSVVAKEASATFHFIDINEVYSNADGTVQFVELIAFFGGQTELHLARLAARDADGTPIIIVLDILTDFPALDSGETILIATAGFEAAAGFAPDYVIPNNALISFPAGRVTWEANAGSIVDGLAYGLYTGANTGFGNPAQALPCDGRRSLTRTIFNGSTNSNNNALAFALRVPSPTRNDGTAVQLILPVGTDCNDNTVPDLCDIATGFSLDANGNHVPDECDPPPGCQGNPEACDDDDVCNGVETCNFESGQCVPGTPPNCDDNDPCTLDPCDPVTGCFTVPRVCDDGDPCNIEECVPGIGCQSESICSPGYSCTGGECSCSEPRGDFDGDGHLDSADTLHEIGCLAGPGGEPFQDCSCADLDGDGDIDLLDLADYFNNLSASGH